MKTPSSRRSIRRRLFATPRQVISLSLANNNLSSPLVLSPYLLCTSLPNIENVSFANNRFANFRDMDPFSPIVGKQRNDKKPKGWPNLKELVLTGNPVVHSAGTDTAYQRSVAIPSSRLNASS